MPERIEDLLHRRSDLSTFLVHLTRAGNGRTGYENLLSIVEDRAIEARSVYGMARAWSQSDGDVSDSQRCVCFTETPLEQVWMMTRDIASRQFALSPYGLAFTKSFGRRMGVNPVWYLDITPGHTWLTNAVNSLVDQARAATPPGIHGPILRLTPFIEQMGPTNDGGRKEFWWEREWRVVGTFAFVTFSKVVAAFVPEDEHDQFVEDVAAIVGQGETWVRSKLPLLDPEWGMEVMIAALAGVSEDERGPIPPY